MDLETVSANCLPAPLLPAGLTDMLNLMKMLHKTNRASILFKTALMAKDRVLWIWTLSADFLLPLLPTRLKNTPTNNENLSKKCKSGGYCSKVL